MEEAVMILLWRHLLESTVACCLVAMLALCVPSGARRSAVWLCGIAKFLIPSVLLAGIGAEVAAVWPAAASSAAGWLARWMHSALLATGWYGRWEPVLPWLVWIWLGGVALTLLGWFVAARRMVLQTEPPTTVQVDLFSRIVRELDAPPVELRVARQSPGVMLRGILRPVVVVPCDLFHRLTADELRAVFVHELAHARRLDNLTGAFAHLVACLFWFHPLLWIAQKQLRREREYACDDEVMARGTERSVYVGALWKVCRLDALESAGTSAMSGTGLRWRLARLGSQKTSLCRAASPLLVGALLVAMSIVPVAGGYCEECVSHGGAVNQDLKEGNCNDYGPKEIHSCSGR